MGHITYTSPERYGEGENVYGWVDWLVLTSLHQVVRRGGDSSKGVRAEIRGCAWFCCVLQLRSPSFQTAAISVKLDCPEQNRALQTDNAREVEQGDSSLTLCLLNPFSLLHTNTRNGKNQKPTAELHKGFKNSKLVFTWGWLICPCLNLIKITHETFNNPLWKS